jgi:succinate dehydrogenase / fumarate reductase cytochrome b subunit
LIELWRAAPRKESSMAAAVTLYRTAIGKKAVMALTGFIGYGYVILHMVGNLHIFEGPTAFNEYAEFLRTVGTPVLPYSGLLWIIRIALLVAVVLHIWSAISLTRQDLASRPQRYAEKKRIAGNYAAMTMRWGGTAIFLFVLFHLADLTFGWLNPNRANWQGHQAAYANVVATFSNPLVVLIYILAMAALGMHLYHGVWSMFQSLGLNNRSWTKIWRGLAVISALVLFIGFSIVPVAVTLGIVH